MSTTASITNVNEHLGRGALLAAAKLSSRFLPDRFLPDKAVLDEVDRKIIQLEMEWLSINSDTEKNQYDADMQRLQRLESKLPKLYDEQADLTARWQAERQAVLGVDELQENIAEVSLEIENAEREYDLYTAAELKYSTLPQLEEQLEAARTKEEMEMMGSGEEGEPMFRYEVLPDDIASIISVWTGTLSTA